MLGQPFGAAFQQGAAGAFGVAHVTRQVAVQQLLITHHDAPGDHGHANVATQRAMHQIVVHVHERAIGEERRHARGIGAHGDDVGLLAGFQ